MQSKLGQGFLEGFGFTVAEPCSYLTGGTVNEYEAAGP